MIDTMDLLSGPIAAVVASLIFFWIVRRETNKTAVIVAQLEEKFRSQVDERIRRLEAKLPNKQT